MVDDPLKIERHEERYGLKREREHEHLRQAAPQPDDVAGQRAPRRTRRILARIEARPGRQLERDTRPVRADLREC